MKITFDVDCTPAEARQFLGLPDIVPLQERMMKELEEKMLENMRTLDAETLMKTWMPLGLESLGDLQKMFWAQMGVNPAGSAAPFSGKSSGKKE